MTINRTFLSESEQFWSVISERWRSRDFSLKVFREIGIHEDYVGHVGDSSFRSCSCHQVMVNLKPFLVLNESFFGKSFSCDGNDFEPWWLFKQHRIIFWKMEQELYCCCKKNLRLQNNSKVVAEVKTDQNVFNEVDLPPAYSTLGL